MGDKRQCEQRAMRSLGYHLYTIWLFTCNDFKTIVYPETAVGVINALSGMMFVIEQRPFLGEILRRTPRVMLWNWLNLLTFTIANQRLPQSVLEDRVNKPWRPIPAERISPTEATRLLLILIPFGILLFSAIGGLRESAVMLILTWMYNDLGGADENYLLRNLINAIGFTCHASGATMIASGSQQSQLNDLAYTWLLLTGLVVFTTLQVQDLADMKGDAERGRRTLPLVHGEQVARMSTAIPVALWSVLLPRFWELQTWGYMLPGLLGSTVVIRVLNCQNVPADKLTYKIWCGWLISLYALPLCRSPGVLNGLMWL